MSRIMIASAACGLAFAALRAAEPRPVADYRCDEGEGIRVHDRSGGHNDGMVVGGAAWAAKGPAGPALLFDGSNHVRIPSAAALDLAGAHAVSVWARGRSSAVHFVAGFPDIRAPYFQVCGETLYLATNSDAFNADDGSPRFQSMRGKDVYHLLTGTADLNLGGLGYTRRTAEPFGGFEPKMQVVGDRIYYEYSGADRRKAVQIWLGESARDGSGWITRPKTDAARLEVLPEDRGQKDTMRVDEALYRVDHGALAVAGDRIYIAFPAKDERNVWQFWTAVCRRDGTGYRAFQRTFDHGWIPSGIQVAGGRVFYLFPKGADDFETYTHNNIPGTAAGPKIVAGYYMASTDLAGENWRVLREVAGPCPGGDPASFQVSGGRIYLIWAQTAPDGSGHSSLFTGDMDLDGHDFHAMQRTFATGYVGTSIAGGVQAVGGKLDYVFTQDLSPRPWAGKRAFSLWLAESNRDGSDWSAKCVLSAPPTVSVGYKGQVVVGAKRYLAPALLPRAFGQGMLGFGGANLIAKGDAYGLGMTEAGNARAFVNVGQDYLFRGEAPLDPAGAAADAPQVLPEDEWHHLVEVYDQRRVCLYVDGRLSASMPAATAPGRNPFPLVIGDGFVGAICEVAIYDSALTPEDVAALFHRHRSG